MSDKNCMNCMRMVPLYDGVERTGQECMNNHGMRVNARMSCEEWRSSDIIGAADVNRTQTK
ncbi:MAG: hypothetical protein IJV24_03205 [Prevotella sp.]|nr:hypothetical protein [Prevotella sp.]